MCEELIPTVSRLYPWAPDPEDCEAAVVPIDPEGVLWFLRIPQTACVDLASWEKAVWMISEESFISSPTLGYDERGVPELCLTICSSERLAILDLVEAVDFATGLHTYSTPEISAWQADRCASVRLEAVERRRAARDEAFARRCMPDLMVEAMEVLIGGAK